MKILRNKSEHGSVLLTGMIISLAVGITLASVLTLASTRYRMTVRSMKWNQAMPVLESGIEEALTHLHDDQMSLTGNGWTAGTLSSQPVLTKARTNYSDGTYFWTVIYNGSSTNPTIYSSGYVPVPLGRGYIYRTVRVTTSRTVEFSHAVAATGLISLNGSPGLVDSYNSCDGSYGGTNSLGHLGSIATDSTAGGAISLGNATIDGSVNTGPGGTVSAGPHGTDLGANDTMNVAFPTNSPPTNSENWTAPPTVTSVTNIVGLTNSGITSATVMSGNYTMSSLTVGSSASPVIVTGPSVLYVTGNLTVQNGGYIQIMPGASLTVYVGGSSTTLSGGGVVNSDGSPEEFTYIGLAGNTSITFNGTASLYGTIYAPEAAITLNGSADVFGAAIVQSFTIHGGSNFHYDACLGALGDLTVSSWQETF